MNYLYTGKVYHVRFTPERYSFKHKIFFMKFPLEELKRLKNSFFSLEKFNLFSFFNKDHGDRKGGDLFIWAGQKLSTVGLELKDVKYRLHTIPRIFGYIFNPVSFWYCYSGNTLVAVIAEINNTFGETHSMVIHEYGKPLEVNKVYTLPKYLHVSPFNDVEGEYQFIMTERKGLERMTINYKVEDKLKMSTYIEGKAGKWSALNLLKQFFMTPLQNIKILGLIHWHALVLYFKKIPFIGASPTKSPRSNHEYQS